MISLCGNEESSYVGLELITALSLCFIQISGIQFHFNFCVLTHINIVGSFIDRKFAFSALMRYVSFFVHLIQLNFAPEPAVPTFY